MEFHERQNVQLGSGFEVRYYKDWQISIISGSWLLDKVFLCLLTHFYRAFSPFLPCLPCPRISWPSLLPSSPLDFWFGFAVCVVVLLWTKMEALCRKGRRLGVENRRKKKVVKACVELNFVESINCVCFCLYCIWYIYHVSIYNLFIFWKLGLHFVAQTRLDLQSPLCWDHRWDSLMLVFVLRQLALQP